MQKVYLSKTQSNEFGLFTECRLVWKLDKNTYIDFMYNKKHFIDFCNRLNFEAIIDSNFSKVEFFRLNILECLIFCKEVKRRIRHYEEHNLDFDKKRLLNMRKNYIEIALKSREELQYILNNPNE